MPVFWKVSRSLYAYDFFQLNFKTYKSKPLLYNIITPHSSATWWSGADRSFVAFGINLFN